MADPADDVASRLAETVPDLRADGLCRPDQPLRTADLGLHVLGWRGDWAGLRAASAAAVVDCRPRCSRPVTSRVRPPDPAGPRRISPRRGPGRRGPRDRRPRASLCPRGDSGTSTGAIAHLSRSAHTRSRSSIVAVDGPRRAVEERDTASASRSTRRTFPPISRTHSSRHHPRSSSSAISAVEADGGGAWADAGPEQRIAEDLPFARPRELPGWAHLGLAELALAGLVVGAATTSIGTEGILETDGLEGTVFGATVVTAVLTLEDLFLTVEPFRKGVPEIGVGNVIGSVVFSVTGKLGITLLAGGIVIGSDVLIWHLPSLIALTGFAASCLATSRLRRWHGCALLALYVAYWIVSLMAFGGAPVELD